MSELDLTKEEKDLVAAMTRNQGVWSTIGFYSAAVVPSLLFAGYGVSAENLVAMAVAFGALLFFVIWLISRELSYVAPFLSIFRKIMAHEQRAALGQPVAGPDASNRP